MFLYVVGKQNKQYIQCYSLSNVQKFTCYYNNVSQTIIVQNIKCTYPTVTLIFQIYIHICIWVWYCLLNVQFKEKNTIMVLNKYSHSANEYLMCKWIFASCWKFRCGGVLVFISLLKYKYIYMCVWENFPKLNFLKQEGLQCGLFRFLCMYLCRFVCVLS